MSDLISGIKSLLENGWRFFTQTDISASLGSVIVHPYVG